MSARKALLAALASLLTLAALALVVGIDAPGLGREVEKRFRSRGIPLEVSRARFRLLEGLLLEDVSVSSSLFESRYQVHVPRMVVEPRLLAFLQGRLEVTGIAFEEARVDFARGTVSIERLGLTLSRADYDPRALTPLHGFSAEGLLTMGRIAFENRELRDLAGTFTTEGGRVRLEELELATGRGELSGELALDFNSLPFRYKASLLGPSFQLEGVGRGALRLEAEGFGTRARDLKGKGTFALERGRLPDAPGVREIDPALAGAEHAPVEIVFDVRDERLYLEKLDLEAGAKIFSIEGSVGLDGSRDLRATKSRSRD